MPFFYEVDMHPKLLFERERKNKIFCGYKLRGGKTALHFHSNVELYAVYKGEVDVWVNENCRRLKKGEIAFMSSYDAHRYEPIGKGAVVSWLIVPTSLCPELSGKNVADPFICDNELFSAVDKLLCLIEKDKNALLTNGCIGVIFGLLLESLDFTERDIQKNTDGMSQALLYLNDNFKNDVSLACAAAHLGYNPSYLSRMFKQTVGITFNAYLTMLRLREAVQLLKNGESVSFCVGESGFNSTRTFYRAFHDEFGCTPKEYVKNQVL